MTDTDGDLKIESKSHHGGFHLDRHHLDAKAGQWDLDPGVFPEGDYMGNSCFTPDGQKVILTNRITDMVTVWDWESMEVLANIEVGEYPSCVAANDDYAIVGCQFSDSIYIISLLDYSITATLPTGEQPCWIALSPGGDTAYVACDIDDVCMAFDLGTQSLIGQIDDFPIYLHTLSWAVQVSRGWEKYNGFVVLHGGDRIAITDPDGYVSIFSAETYELLENIAIEAPRAIALSGDGNYLVCAANPDNVCYVHQISLSDYQVTHSVEISGYGLGTNEVVVNADGSKAYIGTNNNTSTIVRFETEDFITFSSTYTAFWLGVSYDHHYAVSGQNRFSIIDFETESIADQHIGLNQSFGAVSPVAYHVLGYDPLRYEGVYFFDFTDPGNIDYRGSKLSGLDPEGDTPGDVSISNDRSRAVTAGNLSYNTSVIDLEGMETLTAVDLEESCYDVEITPDGQWAVCGGYDLNTLKVIDLSDNSLATTVYTGQRPMVVELSPDGEYAYVGNIKSNTLSVVELDGASSSLVTSVSCGVIGVYIPFFGIRSAVKASPDGSTVLVTASFDDLLKVFDTGSNQVVASLTTGDFPLDVSFNHDGSLACVVNTFDHSYDIVSVDGASSSVLFHEVLSCEYPVDVAYNEWEGLFYICSANSKRIFSIDPQSGEVVETVNTPAAPFHMEFYSGIPVIQYQGDAGNEHKIVYADDVEFILPGSAAPFTLNEMAGIVGVPIPGPDYVSIIDLGPPPFIGENGSKRQMPVYPNPAREMIFIGGDRDYERVEIFDTHGHMVMSSSAKQGEGIDISGLSTGTYVARALHGRVFYHAVFIVE